MSLSALSEHPSLTTHIRRYGQDWTPHSANTSITPYSAVSSFNLPAQYDASLITPVSTTESPSILSKPMRSAFKEKEIKLSPATSSPDYLTYSGDEEYNARLNQPMKMKKMSSNLHITTTEPFPLSPLVCSSPYWGAFGVSATPASDKSANSNSSLGPNQSPNVSAGAFSSDLQNSRQQTPNVSCHAPNYRTQNQAPILIAPNPSALRGANRPGGDSHYRQDSVTSLASTPSSQATTLREYGSEEPLGPLPARRKRKSPPLRNNSEGEMVISGELSREDQILIQLSDKESLQWKEVAQRFNELTGKSMKVPALQMRKKRLRERLRVWNDLERQGSEQIHV